MGWTRIAVLIGLAGAQAWPAAAKVIESSASGFAIEQTVEIKATPEQVYAALTQPALWWSSSHTFSGDAKNLTLDAKAGGCFCERLPDDGSVQHAVVVTAMPRKALVMRGPLGPFQAQGVDSAISFSLEAKGEGTQLVLGNVVGGYMKGGFGEWGARADGMLAEQMVRLKAYLETGKPE